MRRITLLAAVLATMLQFGAPAAVRAQQDAKVSVGIQSRMHLAKELVRERRFEEALELYREIVASAPEDLRARRGLKACLLELKHYDELVVLLEEERERSPDHPAVLSELGTALAQSGDREGAIATWRRILEAQEGSRGSYVTVAGLFIRNRMLDEALAVYTEAEAAHPGRFTRQKAELHALRFDFPAATREYLRYLESNPTTLSHVEDRLLRIGENEDGLGPVIERVEQWVAERSDSSLAGTDAANSPFALVFRKLVGDLHLEAGDHASAGEHYFRLVEEAPEQLASLLTFGERCQSDGRHVVAIEVFERLISEFDDARVVPGALSEIGHSQAELGRWDDALATYARLVEEYPETDWALAGRFETGRILRDGRHDPDGAEAVFRELIRLSAGPWHQADPQFEVAECAVWRGDLEMAQGIYMAVRERPFAPATRERALFEEARVLFHSGQPMRADSLFKAVAQEFPKGVHVNDALEFSILINTNTDGDEIVGEYAAADLRLRMARPDSAAAALEVLVVKHPGAAIVDESLLLLGRAYRAAGEPDRALEVLDRAVAEAQVMDLAASARLLRAEILSEDLGDRAAALAEYEELLVSFPETLAADRARDLSGDLKRVLP